MKRSLTFLLATGVATVVAFAVPTAAHAEETTCRGTIGAVTVDNLRVASGTACTLNGTRVQGTIKVESNARLTATSVRVIGNVQGENFRFVKLVQSTVGGSVQLVQGGGATIRSNEIEGTLLFDDNNGSLIAANNTIDSDLQVYQNSGGVAINKNRIDGNLQCKENQPPPTGGGNIVQGNKEDQCARL